MVQGNQGNSGNSLTNDMILKYGSIISAVVFGSILIGYLIYMLVSRTGPKKFKGNRSLDTIYDDAGGNEALSNARLTSDINISSDKYSCKYQVIYEGTKKREVNCIEGCDGDDEDNKEFCKSYEYPGGTLGLDNPLLDQTYVNRKSESEDEDE
tara:strand:- start:16 stop:474 length:459 start_codon:yes stop_codon:yes gene_type:complete